MLICPNCNTQYDDDTLKFCLKDGTQLTPASINQSPAFANGETETVVSARPSAEPWPSAAVARKSNTGLAVALTAFGMLVIFGIVGVGAWIYLKGDEGGTAKNANATPDISRSTNSKAASTVTPAAASTNSPAFNNAAPPVAAPPAVNADEVRREVAKTVMTWKSTAESLDLDSYMGNYADTLDYYYLKKSVRRSFVRDNKQKAFSMYDSIKINITNMSITTGASGQDATVVCDKEWIFEGAGKRSSGKVQQKMGFKNFNGEWLITGEKDLHLYYKN